jgi:diacylglycerol O-acyltransferase / wax synthase
MRMSDAEAVMWAVEKDPALRSDFINVTVLDRPPDAARLRATLETALAEVPRLAQRVVSPPLRIAPPEWRDDPTLDVDYHLRRVAAPAPGGLRELLDLAATVAAAPFDRSRPLWEFTVVEGLEGGRAALLQKVHHTIIDGVGGVKLSLSLLDFERDPEAEPAEVGEPSTARRIADEVALEEAAARDADPIDRTTPVDVVVDAVRYAIGQRLERARRRLDSAGRLVTHPDTLPRGVADAVGLLGSIRRQVLVTQPARSQLLNRRSLGRRFEAVQEPLAEAKRAAEVLGGSVNDLFVTAVAGALGTYHERMGAPCDELRMAMPVNLRAGGEGAAGNNFAPSRILVPTSPKDPAARFAAVHERLAGVRDDPGLTATWSMASLVAPLPTSLLVTLARSQARTIDFVASNLRGSPVDLYLAGARIEANFPMGPRAGCPVNVTLLSYKDSLDMGLNLDPAAVSDAPALVGCLEESFTALLDAA